MNRLLFRHRVQPLCMVGQYLTALIRLYQHSSDRWFRPRALSWRNRSLQRCSVISTLSVLVLPAILLHVSPTFAMKTVSSKVLGFDIVLTFAFAFLVCVFVLVVFVVLTFLAFCLCLYLSCPFLLHPVSRDPWVQHHQLLQNRPGTLHDSVLVSLTGTAQFHPHRTVSTSQ